MNRPLSHNKRIARPYTRFVESWAVIAVAWLLLTFSNVAPAVTSVQRNFEELVTLADQIVVGTVASRESRWRDPVQQRGIVTQITLTNLEWLKGKQSGQDFVLHVAGGQIGPYGEAIGGVPQLSTGQRYVLFVRGNNQSLFPVVGIEQGVLTVRDDAQGQARIYTFRGLPLTQVEHIGTPTRAAIDAPALPLARLRQHVDRLLEDQSIVAP